MTEAINEAALNAAVVQEQDIQGLMEPDLAQEPVTPINSEPGFLQRNLRRLEVGGAAVLSAFAVNGAVGVAAANQTRPTARVAQVAKKPIRPLQLENRTVNFIYHSNNPAFNNYGVGVNGNPYKGGILGDATTWTIARHEESVTGPCGKDGLGDMKSYQSISKNLGNVYVLCADQTNSGHSERVVTSIKSLCQSRIASHETNATLKQCEAVDLESAVVFGGNLAAESVGLSPRRFGPASKIEVTGFNKQAVINYRKGEKTGAKKLKELTLTLINGHVDYKEIWY